MKFKKFSETIVKVDGKYRLLSKKGKNLGTYDTKQGAIDREKQVQYFKHMKEGVIDIPRKTYAKGVFDNADTDNPKLKQSVLNMIMKTVKKDFEKYAPVVSVMLIGSILTKRYRNDADLDLDLLLDVPPADRLTMREAINNNLKNINGKLIPGTKHPINYYVHTDPQINKEHLQTADGVYDVMKNKFVRKPIEQSFDPKQYEADFQKKVKEVDVVKGELQRDIIDYKELQALEPSDIENLQSLVSK